MRKNILVTGAGGFIGGHLVNRLRKEHNVRAIDIKPVSDWYQVFNDVDNYSFDLSDFDKCYAATKNIDEVYHLGCNMGGMGFISNNKALCMLSIIPDSMIIKASKANSVKKFLYTSTACVYPTDQQESSEPIALSEDMAYPPNPEDGYGWEKLFMERMCRHFNEDFGLDTRIVRFHTIYGPYGDWQGGREKAPAALCRKVIDAIETGTNEIEVWGDGEQIRTFLYVDDAVNGLLSVMNSDGVSADGSTFDINNPFNIGSDIPVTINEYISIVENIAGVTLSRKYIDGPRGVNARSSDNSRIEKLIGWSPSTSLEDGVRKTFDWIYEEYKKTNKVT